MNNYITVFKKELTDIFRDKKSLLFTLILPIVLYPLMFKFVSSSVQKTENDAKNEIVLAVEGDTTSGVMSVLANTPNIVIKNDISNYTDALKQGDIQLIVNIPDNFDNNIINNTKQNLQILYDDNSQLSGTSASILYSIFDEYSNTLVKANLVAQGIDPSVLTPFTIEVKSGISESSNDGAGIGGLLIGMIPSFIIIFMVSSTLGMASDLGAGEKERFTFEPLLSTSAKRDALLWGKIGAMCVVSFMALIANMVSMIVSMNLFMNDGGSLNISLTPVTIIGVLSVGIFVLVSLSALQMAISLYARSTKESNTYLGAITMPVFLLAYLPMMMDAKNISSVFFHIPIANAVSVMKELMVGIVNYQHLGIVLAWHLVYVILSIVFAKYMFSKEEVIFRT